MVNWQKPAGLATSTSLLVILVAFLYYVVTAPKEQAAEEIGITAVTFFNLPAQPVIWLTIVMLILTIISIASWMSISKITIK